MSHDGSLFLKIYKKFEKLILLISIFLLLVVALMSDIQYRQLFEPEKGPVGVKHLSEIDALASAYDMREENWRKEAERCRDSRILAERQRSNERLLRLSKQLKCEMDALVSAYDMREENRRKEAQRFRDSQRLAERLAERQRSNERLQSLCKQLMIIMVFIFMGCVNYSIVSDIKNQDGYEYYTFTGVYVNGEHRLWDTLVVGEFGYW